MATQAERREATRTKLLSVSREHFFHNGYEGTHTNDILEDTGLSRGALYHHFKSKQDLFEAVFIDTSNESVAYAMRNSTPTDSPLEKLIAACTAWLRAVRRPASAVILLDQGPKVLGWKRARELEDRASFSIMKKSLQQAVAEGEIEVHSVDLAARFINAMLTEAALTTLYKNPNSSASLKEKMIRQFIEGLRLPIER